MISLALILLAAICNACMDVLYAHFYSSPFAKLRHTFWNPEMSWENKWYRGRPENGEAFFGSSTFLVWITDGWHLFKAGMLISLIAAIVLYHPMLCGLIDGLILMGVWGLSFETTYRLLKK